MSLLAGAATQVANKPAMPTTALRSRVLNPPDEDEGDDDDVGLPIQVLPDRDELRKKIEEYVCIAAGSMTIYAFADWCVTGILGTLSCAS